MAAYDLTRLKRLVIIYRTIQVALVGLFLFMAYNFILLFGRQGTPEFFTKALLLAMVVQLLLLYPAWWLAGRDLAVEVEAGLVGITPEQLVTLRRRRLLGDLWKLSALGFFIVFIIMVPDAGKGRGVSLILAASYFSFLLATLTYLQCFNLRAGRKRKELSG
ncbi:hypothetical protein [Trichlorobacter ammonificans]|uniref:Transmembrane protein n=1 Tax=Trichlorobacter ammonificans TaxID=2916410 RepID=A0ABN8HF99_9BACT|nr:hypothetical protein [Trichlorobacter ammonificans]CAH2030241.1 conserved membrane protein of unknown function [Trichlorobacter ammonificans]